MGENRDYITFNDEKGSINIAEDVVASIAASAAVETEGVAALSTSLGKDIAELLGKKNLSKGVRVSLEEDSIKVDAYVLVELGCAVNKVGIKVQENIVQAVESATGIKVVAVDVHICGISLNKAKA